MSKTGQALLRGGTVRVIAQAVTILVGMLLLPFILTKLGDRLYGAWVIIGTVTGYYGLLDFGLASAVSRFVSRALGRGDRTNANEYIAASFTVFCIGGLLALILTLLVVLGCGWFLSNPTEITMFRQALLLSGCALSFALPARCFDGILAAHIRFDLLGYLEIGASLLRSALILLILSHNGQIVAMALAGAVVALLRGIAAAAFARRVHGQLTLKTRDINRSRVNELFGYAIYTFIARIADMFRFNITPFIISFALGLDQVTPFAIADRLRRAIAMACTSIMSTLTPVFSRQEGCNDHEAIKRTYLFSYKISCYLGVYLIGMVFICAADFITRWIGTGRDDITLLVYIAMAGLLFSVIQIPTVNLLYGISRNRFYAISNSIQAIATVILCFCLIRSLAIPGVVLATAAVNFLIKVFVQAREAGRILKIPFAVYHIHHTLINILKPASFLVVVAMAAKYSLAPSYLNLILTGLVATALYAIYIFFIGFNKTERALFTTALGFGSK